jgi:hypothetical protein
MAETSLVAMAAYPAAGVDTIAAAKPMEGATPMSEPTPAPEPTRARARARAGAPARVLIAERPAADMRLGEYVQTLVRAER